MHTNITLTNNDFTNLLDESAFMTRDYYKLRINFRDLRNLNTVQEIKDGETKFRQNVESLEKHNKIYSEAITNAKGKALYDDYYNMLAQWKDAVLYCFILREGNKEQEFKELFDPLFLLEMLLLKTNYNIL